MPLAPAGEQKAPGVTVCALNVGSEFCVGARVTSGAGIADGGDELVGVGTTGVVSVKPQEAEIEISVSDSFVSAVKEYLLFIDIQF